LLGFGTWDDLRKTSRYFQYTMVRERSRRMA
jgi:hypothetical protein